MQLQRAYLMSTLPLCYQRGWDVLCVGAGESRETAVSVESGHSTFRTAALWGSSQAVSWHFMDLDDMSPGSLEASADSVNCWKLTALVLVGSERNCFPQKWLHVNLTLNVLTFKDLNFLFLWKKYRRGHWMLQWKTVGLLAHTEERSWEE